MRTTIVRIAVCLWATILLGVRMNGSGQERQNRSLVEFSGLEAAYESCAMVNFSVRNISAQGLYVEIYPEVLKQGSWENVECQYNLNDPETRHSKRFPLNPKMMSPRESLQVRYDRCSDYEYCMRRFGKEGGRAAREMLKRQDARASSPLSQRIRAEVYVRDAEWVKEAGTVYSQPFTRLLSIK